MRPMTRSSSAAGDRKQRDGKVSLTPSPGVLAWLAGLPVIKPPPSDDSLTVRGLLVRSSPGRVRIVVDEQSLDFDQADVTDIQVLHPPEDLRVENALHVRIWLRPNSRLLRADPVSAELGALFTRQRPFAVAVRRTDCTVEPAPSYRRIEAEYLARHGLAPEPP
jgi:hypothetical protein